MRADCRLLLSWFTRAKSIPVLTYIPLVHDPGPGPCDHVQQGLQSVYNCADNPPVCPGFGDISAAFYPDIIPLGFLNYRLPPPYLQQKRPLLAHPHPSVSRLNFSSLSGLRCEAWGWGTVETNTSLSLQGFFLWVRKAAAARPNRDLRAPRPRPYK